MHYDHIKSANGQLVMDQQLREEIVWRNNPLKWWKYMGCIYKECNLVTEYELCSSKCLKRQNISVTVINDSMHGTFNYDGSNNLLRYNVETTKASGADRFPSVTINNLTMRGSITAEFMFDDICNSLLKPPRACSQATKITNHLNYDYSDWMVIIGVILLGAGIFSLLFCVYKRYVRKKISSEMQHRVDDMVSKYIEFYSERRK